jgi:2-polyprenyl-3-methyl-5-hydroxy-6-metoxy-1,4-benzoquinol methylase
MNSIKNCRSCNSSDLSNFFFFHYTFKKKKWKKYFCNNCTFINYLPSKKINYKSQYRTISKLNNLYPIDPWMFVSSLRWKKIYQLIKKKKKSNILDYGGYNGFLLFGLNQKIKRLKGTVADLDPEGLKFAKNIGLKTINLAKDKISSKYDIILIVQVLEHIAYPRKLLLNLSKNLKKDGMIYIEAPNVYRFPMSDLAHINEFNAVALEKCLTSLNYEVVQSGYTQTDSFSNNLEYYWNSKKENIFFLIKKKCKIDKKNNVSAKVGYKTKVLRNIYLGQTYSLMIVSIRMLRKSIGLLKNSIKYALIYLFFIFFYIPFCLITLFRSR